MKHSYILVIPRLLLILFVFVASLVLGAFYTEGDQVHYRRVYLELSNLDLIQAFAFYNLSLSSYELTHFFFSWVASRFIEKDIFIAFFNALLALFVILNFDKKKVYLVITALFVVSNFYLWVLFLSAERLKFGILFFLISMYYADRIKIFMAFSFLSVVSHIQIAILYSGILLNWMVNEFRYTVKTGRASKQIIYILILVLITFFIIWNQVQVKFFAHFELSVLLDYLRIMVFFLMAIYYSRKKQETFFIFIPLFIAVMLFGGERVNLFAYFVFLYYALQVNRGVNVGVLLTSLYFAYTSFGFIMNVINHGNGFYAG